MDPTIDQITLKSSFDRNSYGNSKPDIFIKAPDLSPKLFTANVQFSHDLTDYQLDPQIIDLKLYQELVELHRHFNRTDFVAARCNANPYERLGTSIFLNRASIKLVNVMSVFDLFRYNNNPNITWSGTAEAPGGFAVVLKWLFPNSTGYLISLKPDQGGIAWNIRNNLNMNFYYGSDDSGNLYSQSLNFSQYVLNHSQGGIYLHTADGGFDVDNEDDIERKEFLTTRLILAEILVGLKIVRIGGHMIIKIFNTLTEISKQMLMMLTAVFEKIYLFKPISSRPANTEKYLVALNKKNVDLENLIRIFETAWTTYNDTNVLTNLINYNPTDPNIVGFTKWLADNNNFLAKEQLYYSYKIIDAMAGLPLNFPPMNLYKALTYWGVPDNRTIVNNCYYRRPANLPEFKNIEPITPIINPKLSSREICDLEYNRWLNYQLIWDTFYSYANNNQKTKYEITNVIVRFFLWWSNYNEAYEKVRSEAVQQLNELKIEMNDETFDLIMSIKNPRRISNINNLNINRETGFITYGSFKFYLHPNRIEIMLRAHSDDYHFIQTCLRYNIIKVDTGNFWSAPPQVYKYLQDIGVEYEAFANALAHNLPKYFSPYPDTDKTYGSLGSFLTSDLMPGKYSVNPPYTMDFISLTNQILLKTLANTEGKTYTFFCFYPYWSSIIGELIESPYCKCYKNLANITIYDMINEKTFKANFFNIYIILSNDPSLVVNCDELVNNFY